MRFGGPVFLDQPDPEAWIVELKRLGYRAAYCPVDHSAAPDVTQSFVRAAQAADIVIAEVGAWSNPLSRDDEERRNAITFCQNRLALAEEIGARCCVNIAGSRGDVWDCPHPDNLVADTFDLIVDTTRAIIDAVQPTRTFFTLEPMPWMYPDGPESYLRLIHAIDRPHFAVHLDPVNWICSPQLFFGNGDFIRECFRTLGPYIKSCHAKDITLGNTLTVHLDEVRPGLGSLDYVTLLHEMERLDPNTPFMLEHLPNAQAYDAAAAYVRTVAQQEGVTL